MAELTPEQRAAVESRGKVITSASAGSGKTFVMIEKLTRAIIDGADLDSVLAVTFTKKAAAQMKEKLRGALINRVDGADAALKSHLKTQIAKIPTADISTIHSFCSRLLRTYFYLLDIDGSFEITSDDDAMGADLKERALDELFDELYLSGDDGFLRLLKVYVRKRSDEPLRKMLLDAYSSVRNTAGYRQMLESAGGLYSEEGFAQITEEYTQILNGKLDVLEDSLREFEQSFPVLSKDKIYRKIFDEMQSAIDTERAGGLFGPAAKPSLTNKPTDAPGEEQDGQRFKKFKEDFTKSLKKLREGILGRGEEYERFIKSGVTAADFSRLLLLFDDKYTAAKRDENRLDYGDLEHLALKLLNHPEAGEEIRGKYKYVFVDEYQDVNPVQESILSNIGQETFLVGDRKQAIYGFRGSKSQFFSDKLESYKSGGGTSLQLSGNFRSTPAVLGFVNTVFSTAMRRETCGFDYLNHDEMTSCAKYPQDAGGAVIEIFGKDGKDAPPQEVYSVKKDDRKVKYSREGLAVLKVVEEELTKRHFVLGEDGGYTDTRPGDICILVRKKGKGSEEEIIHTLTDAGYSVSGGQEGNICKLPEVKCVLDILSLIDNAEQDIPLATAMLSPLGSFTEDELALIRLKNPKEKVFGKCCKDFSESEGGYLAQKLNAFWEKLQAFRDLSEILPAGELIDRLLCDSGMEAAYSAGSGEKLKNVLKLAAEGPDLPLTAFLSKIKAGGFNVKAAAASSSDSIKVMTMHASKGLEFPVVIVADICRSFKGDDKDEMPFDEKYGFTPKYYDVERGVTGKTVLRRLARLRQDREELKNELNLFYVACTRATNRLHVMAEEIPAYSRRSALSASDYAHTFDMTKLPINERPAGVLNRTKAVDVDAAQPDPSLVSAMEKSFMRPYAYEQSISLPVKSSASAILKSLNAEEIYPEHQLFSGEGETSTERGTAYHRFLELCDFSINSRDGVKDELENLIHVGKITQEQADLLEAEQLCKILSMPVFSDLHGAKLYREREFLCRLKANEILPTPAEDYILVQGAIDLFADFGGRIKIIDYKFSHKSLEMLKSAYSAQLALYKRAASVITGVAPENIQTVIVNIFTCAQTEL